MIDALIGGTLHAAAVEKTASNGKPYATAKVRASVGTESVFVNVICFDATACAALLALHAGEPVALAGELTPKVWTPANGEPRPVLDMVAHAVLTTYAVQRKRKASEAPAKADTVALDEGEPWHA